MGPIVQIMKSAHGATQAKPPQRPIAWRSALLLEKFPETLNGGYFLIKVAAVLLALLTLAQALLDLRKPA